MNENSFSWDVAGIRKILADVFDDVELVSLCQDEFPRAYSKLSRGMRHDEIINIIIGEFLPANDFKKLVEVINKHLAEKKLDYFSDFRNEHHDNVIQGTPSLRSKEDWGEAINIRDFVGRNNEIEEVVGWTKDESCKLIAIFGMGGIGKTSLAVKVSQLTKSDFDYFFWRDLRNAPRLESILEECVKFISDQQITNIPEGINDAISILLELLKNKRCLIVLDNIEPILQAGDVGGTYRKDFENYGLFLNKFLQFPHNSCLIVTSRERPKEIFRLDHDDKIIRVKYLSGLAESDAQELFKLAGLDGSENEFATLITRYEGNPLALKQVASAIRELFNGTVKTYLTEAPILYGDIYNVLDQQFDRLSELERSVLLWLAIEREAISLSTLAEDFLIAVTQRELFEALDSLRRRYLVETSTGLFLLQSVVMEYLTDLLVQNTVLEIEQGQPRLVYTHAILKATSKDYVRDSQHRLVLEPISRKLISRMGKDELRNKLQNQVAEFRDKHYQKPSYFVGNIINILVNSGIDLKGLDFSNTYICQAFLRGAKLHDVSFYGSSIYHCVFSEVFSGILAVAINPGGDLLATGDANGEIQLWQIKDGKKIRSYKGHSSWIWDVSFSRDGAKLVSASDDETVKIWNIESEQCIKTLKGHRSRVWSAFFIFDDTRVVSSSEDSTIRVWDVESGNCKNILHAHEGHVWSIAANLDALHLASAGEDQTIKIWDMRDGVELRSLRDHESQVLAIAFSPNGDILASGDEKGRLFIWRVQGYILEKSFQAHGSGIRDLTFTSDGTRLASCSEDKTVKIWDLSNLAHAKTVLNHSGRVRSIAFTPNAEIIVSGSENQVVRFWETVSGKCIKTLQGKTQNRVMSVDFSPDGEFVISGSDDHIVRVWDIKNSICVDTLHGHKNWVWSVRFSPDGKYFASAGDDKTIKLWDARSYACLDTIYGHTNWIWSVDISNDGKWLVSASEDQTIRLWDFETKQCTMILSGHDRGVQAVRVSPDNRFIASGGQDQTIRIWDISNGDCIKVLLGHTNRVRGLSFSPDGRFLVSSSEDQTVKLWNIEAGECQNTFLGHEHRVMGVAFNPDGKQIASCSFDKTIKLWDVQSGECIKNLVGHKSRIRSLIYNFNGSILASASEDETINLWNTTTGSLEGTLEILNPYDGLNISKTNGLTNAQIANLIELGAHE